MACRFHLKSKHTHKIRTCNALCINRYIVDLQCRNGKTSCSFPRKQCNRLQIHRLNSISTTGSSSLQKVTPHLRGNSSIRNCASSTQVSEILSRSDKKDLKELMDREKRQCLECKRKFQSVSNLERHVVRHLGKKDFQCKSCSRLMYSSSECRSHIKKQHLGKVKGITLKTLDKFVIDLKNKQIYSDSEKNSTEISSSGLSSVSLETDSKVTASQTQPKSAQLSVLSTRKEQLPKARITFGDKN